MKKSIKYNGLAGLFLLLAALCLVFAAWILHPIVGIFALTSFLCFVAHVFGECAKDEKKIEDEKQS